MTIGSKRQRPPTRVAVPEAIKCRGADSFAFRTLTERLPRILRDARRAAPERHYHDRRWDRLIAEIIDSKPIDSSIFMKPTKFWNTFIQSVHDMPWGELPFFETEFLFYHAINSIVDYFGDGADVFAGTREQALELALRALPGAASRIERVPDCDLTRKLVRLAADSNAVDFSQNNLRDNKGQTPTSRLLIDDSSALAASLGNDEPLVVEYLADNAGLELCLDLLLINEILLNPNARVTLHLKPWPMFVSDALVSDVQLAISAMKVEPEEWLRETAAALSSALESSRLTLEASVNWGEPRHISQLDEELARKLERASVTISKGDLNYRRFIEDRAWPAVTDTRVASVAKSRNTFALRILKSDAVVGLPSALVNILEQERPEWRTNGCCGVVQNIGN